MKRIAVFGSTGSIGVQTLNVVRRFPHEFSVVALSGGGNTGLLARQICEFSPALAASVRQFSEPDGTRVFFGDDAAERMAEECEADICVMAISGLAALPPLMKIISRGCRIALANKEAIVCAGDIVLSAAEASGSEIIPVDSEHSAVFQCLAAGRKEDVKRIILTASGGPFYSDASVDLDAVTPEMALRHPTWNMGGKITVDSATMVNKGLEIIEAHRLFGIKNVDYVIHPESIVHSLVEYKDNSTVALMSYPNMELAIQYALTYPGRMENAGVRAFDFARSLTFHAPDEKRFPAPAIARRCMEIGGTAPAIYSIADEVAVSLFLKNRVRFTDICGIIEEALSINEIERSFGYDDLLRLADETANYFGRKFGVKL